MASRLTNLPLLVERYGVYGAAITVAAGLCYLVDKFIGETVIIPNRWFILICFLVFATATVVPYHFVTLLANTGYKSPRVISALRYDGRSILLIERSDWIIYNTWYTVLFKAEIEYEICLAVVLIVQDDGRIQLQLEPPLEGRASELFARVFSNETQNLAQILIKPGAQYRG